MNDRKTYAAIDLKSFYASVECVERGLDPLDTNLVVADVARTEKTICLAVSPSLKAYGISGRARLFEVVSACAAANAARRRAAPYGRLVGSSYSATALANDKRLALDYIAAPPRMAKYLEYSAKIYSIYLKFVAPEDVHVYSVDEVFIDISSYLRVQKLTAREFVRRIILAVFEETGITKFDFIDFRIETSYVLGNFVHKKLVLFAAQTDEIPHIMNNEEISEYRFASPKEAKKLLHPDCREIIEALERILK